MPFLWSYFSRYTIGKQSTKMFVYLATPLIGYSDFTIVDKYYEYDVIRG
jgi:hypothetical protein